jgi:hypothetical protein
VDIAAVQADLDKLNAQVTDVTSRVIDDTGMQAKVRTHPPPKKRKIQIITFSIPLLRRAPLVFQLTLSQLLSTCGTLIAAVKNFSSVQVPVVFFFSGIRIGRYAYAFQEKSRSSQDGGNSEEDNVRQSMNAFLAAVSVSVSSAATLNPQLVGIHPENELTVLQVKSISGTEHRHPTPVVSLLFSLSLSVCVYVYACVRA